MWIIMKKLKDKISLQWELNWQYSHWRRIFEIIMVWRDVISFYECDPILFLFFATGYWRDPHYPLDNKFYQGYSKTRSKCGLTWQSYWDSRGNTGGDRRRGSSTSRTLARRNHPAPHLSWPQTSCWDRSQCCLGSWTWISSSRRPESRRCEYNETDQTRVLLTL